MYILYTRGAVCVCVCVWDITYYYYYYYIRLPNATQRGVTAQYGNYIVRLTFVMHAV